MKNTKNRFRLFWVLCLFLVALCAGTISAQAAKVTAPPKVKVSWQLRSDTSVTIKWTASAGAAGYVIVEKYTEKGKTKTRQLTTARTYINRTVEQGSPYYYQVRAFKKNGSKKVYSANSNSVKALAPITKPTISVTKYESNAVTVSWKKIQNALGYRVYLYNPKGTRKYQVYKETRALSCRIDGLSTGVTYQVVVRAILPNGASKKLGPSSNVVKATVSRVVLSGIHGRYWNATVKYNTYAVDTATKKKVLLKKGTKLICTARKTGSIMAKIGTKAEATGTMVVRVSGKALNFGTLAVTSSAKYVYTRQQKESYINSTNIASVTNYLIWVNQFTCQTTIFKGSTGKWEQIRSMNCVVGKFGNTPQGKFHIRKKGWDPDLGGNVSWFTWNQTKVEGNAFHAYVDKHTRGAYSHGCVRVSRADRDYIYYNIPMGTMVWSY